MSELGEPKKKFSETFRAVEVLTMEYFVPEDIKKAAFLIARMHEGHASRTAFEIAQAILAERERCAKICEDHGHSNGRILATHKHLAATIRAGG